jgi:hypothetical protein
MSITRRKTLCTDITIIITTGAVNDIVVAVMNIDTDTTITTVFMAGKTPDAVEDTVTNTTAAAAIATPNETVDAAAAPAVDTTTHI